MLSESTAHQQTQLVMPAATLSNASGSNGGMSNGENGTLYTNGDNVIVHHVMIVSYPIFGIAFPPSYMQYPVLTGLP